MTCEIIFYLAGRTRLCEKALRNSISGLNLKLKTSLFATTPRDLGSQFINALERNNVVFVVGGLGTDERTGTENVFSKALANKTPDDLKKLRNPLSTADGYLVRRGGQLIVLLPDDPDQLQAMLKGELFDYLESFTNV